MPEYIQLGEYSVLGITKLVPDIAAICTQLNVSKAQAPSCLEGQFSAGNEGEAGCRAARRQAGNLSVTDWLISVPTPKCRKINLYPTDME